MAEIRACTKEEIEELRTWFEAHMTELPESVEILPGLIINDLPRMIDKYLKLYTYTKGTGLHKGQMTHLYALKEKLQEMGIK